MAAKQLDSMNKMGMEACSPSHSRSSDAPFHTTDDSGVSFKVSNIDLRLGVAKVMIRVSREGKGIQICYFKT